ncbi:MAG: NAD(P)H-hydrate dehydratase [Planctomycetota bacterium]|jgi:NAD(P)H-hydrate epimerase
MADGSPDSLPSLPPRPPDGHKGTFGTVCVIGAQAAAPRVMLGGPAFAALGALRAGCGLAILAVPAPLMADALVVAPAATGLALPVDEKGDLRPSAVAALLDEYRPLMDCLAVGPGMGAAEPQQQVLLRLIAQEHLPLVVDADGLNAMAAAPEFYRDLRAPAVLTPHPGEYRKLVAALRLDADPVDPDRRPDAAAQLAQRLGCVIVLKGTGTVVSDGLNTWTNRTGNVALATAGTGDVLTGVIAGLVAQFGSGHLSLFECARLGVYLHGLAADRWACRHGLAGMLATDLLEEIPGTLAAMRDPAAGGDGAP